MANVVLSFVIRPEVSPVSRESPNNINFTYLLRTVFVGNCIQTYFWFNCIKYLSLCRDYVTEKLFEALNFNILPIVFGGSDYKSWMPYKSFIDATLMTPKQLADHLVEIGSNKHKYLSYFRWKHNFHIKSGLDQNFEVFCYLCKILNDFRVYGSHSSDDLINWWFKTSECKSWANSANNQNNYINIFR